MIMIDDNIWLLDPNKPHGLDKVFIFILKICGNCISKFLALIFHDCLETYILWNGKITLFLYMKGDKNNIKTTTQFPFFLCIFLYIGESLKN